MTSKERIQKAKEELQRWIEFHDGIIPSEDLEEFENDVKDRQWFINQAENYSDLCEQVPKVYNEFTQYSKPHTRAEYIIAAINDRMIDKQMAFDDLTIGAEKDEVYLSVDYLKSYFDIK